MRAVLSHAALTPVCRHAFYQNMGLHTLAVTMIWLLMLQQAANIQAEEEDFC